MKNSDLLDLLAQAAREQTTALDLSGRGISKLPPEIGSLASLESLNLRNNLLEALPESIGQLASLKALDLRSNVLEALPESIGQLACLRTLSLRNNRLAALPESIGDLANLQMLHLMNNQLAALPDSVGQLASLVSLDLWGNLLAALPESIGQLSILRSLDLMNNQLVALPKSIGQLARLQSLDLRNNLLEDLPESIGQLASLQSVTFWGNRLEALPESVGQLTGLSSLDLDSNQLVALPESIDQLGSLQSLDLRDNRLAALPESIGQLASLKSLDLRDNELAAVPESLCRLASLHKIHLEGNPLNPFLQSAYDQGLNALRAYLRSLAEAEPLYEAKLLVVGEGAVGKTTLLKALMGGKPRTGETTTHGVDIKIGALTLPHPSEPGVAIQLNAWDFGGQDVYRPTHQFFFSPRAVFLLVWEPRLGVQRCQVEDWLKLIRLRVGQIASVIVVSTHARTGQRIARIDQDVLRRDYPFIAGFCEVDSLVPDPATGQMTGIPCLEELIARTAAALDHMGQPFSRRWREARDRLLAQSEPRITFTEFTAICATHGLDLLDTRTLAALMHDLGYIVHYRDDDRLRDDVVLQPEWLTKAIGFALEDRTTAELDGILPDARLKQIWHDHPADGLTRYAPSLYPFFLRLMEKFDVAYRLEDGTASLVAQHVPQVRPALPWLPDSDTVTGLRRIALACVMAENPPGLIPWMIVRTHDYECCRSEAEGQVHRLHWQKGMFLENGRHGQAFLELRGRELHVVTQAIYPEYFSGILLETVQNLISNNWPGLEGRYFFAVPCPERANGWACPGRFDIAALRQFLNEGDRTIRCQACRKRQSIANLLYGFVDETLSAQLANIEARLEGLDSRVANYLWVIMRAIATESKEGPRLFTIEPTDGNWYRFAAKRYRLHLWCEAEGEQHPITEPGKGTYEFNASRDWLIRAAPYAKFVAGVLKTVLPVVTPAVDIINGYDTARLSGLKACLDRTIAASDALVAGIDQTERPPQRGKLENEYGPSEFLSSPERAGILALHALLRDLDPNHARLGLHRVSTYTGDYVWLCDKHYGEHISKTPDSFQFPSTAPADQRPL